MSEPQSWHTLEGKFRDLAQQFEILIEWSQVGAEPIRWRTIVEWRVDHTTTANARYQRDMVARRKFEVLALAAESLHRSDAGPDQWFERLLAYGDTPLFATSDNADGTRTSVVAGRIPRACRSSADLCDSFGTDAEMQIRLGGLDVTGTGAHNCAVADEASNAPPSTRSQREELYSAWKERNRSSGSVKRLYEQCKTNRTDLGKWRRNDPKFPDDSTVSERIVRALKA